MPLLRDLRLPKYDDGEKNHNGATDKLSDTTFSKGRVHGI